MRGTLPSELGRLTALTQLVINFQRKLSGALPRELARLTNMAVYFIDGCDFVGPHPDTSEWRALFLFGCASNSLTGNAPSVANAPLLEHYQIHNNAFSGPFPAFHPSALSRLRIVLLHNNLLSGNVPIGFATSRECSIQNDVRRRCWNSFSCSSTPMCTCIPAPTSSLTALCQEILDRAEQLTSTSTATMTQNVVPSTTTNTPVTTTNAPVTVQVSTARFDTIDTRTTVTTISEIESTTDVSQTPPMTTDGKTQRADTDRRSTTAVERLNGTMPMSQTNNTALRNNDIDMIEESDNFLTIVIASVLGGLCCIASTLAIACWLTKRKADDRRSDSTAGMELPTPSSQYGAVPKSTGEDSAYSSLQLSQRSEYSVGDIGTFSPG